MYEVCPQQYKFTYVDFLADEYKTPKPYLTMGAHVHNSLKDFYELPPAQRNYDILEKLLRKRWRENRRGFLSRDDERDWGMKALQMLKLYVHKNDIAPTPLLLENYYDMLLTEDVKVLGRIDRIDQDAQGLHVIDYKTGKFNEAEISEEQLIVYAMIIQANQKIPVYKASYLFLATNQWYSLDITEDMFVEISATILAKVEKMRAERLFTPKISSYCRHCDFLEICPQSKEAKLYLETTTHD